MTPFSVARPAVGANEICPYGGRVDCPHAPLRTNEIRAYAGRTRKRTVPYSTGVSLATHTSTISPETSHSISFMIFMASMMHTTWPGFTIVPTWARAGEPGDEAA